MEGRPKKDLTLDDKLVLLDRLYKEPFDSHINKYLYGVENTFSIKNKFRFNNDENIKNEAVETIFKNMFWWGDTNYEASKYTEFKDVMEHYIGLSIEDFSKKPLLLARDSPSVDLKSKLEKFVKRKNLVNHRETHFMSATSKIAPLDVPLEVKIATFLHDYVEDMYSYNQLIGKKRSMKDIHEQVLKPLKKYSNLDYELVSTLVDKLTMKPFDNYNIKIDKNLDYIGLDHKDALKYMKGISEMISVPKWFHSENLTKRGTKRKNELIDTILYTFLAKIGGDRVHNTSTMRPDEREFDKLLGDVSLSEAESIAYSDQLAVRKKIIDEVLKYEESEGIVCKDRQCFDSYKNEIDVYDLPIHLFAKVELNKYRPGFESVHEKLNDLGIKFNTTKHPFIISNLFKNLIIISQAKRFLNEEVYSNNDYDNPNLVNLLEHTIGNLADLSIKQAMYQSTHPMAFHRNYNFENIIDTFRDSKLKDYSRFTKPTEDDHVRKFDGAVEYWFLGALGKDPLVVDQLNEPWLQDEDMMKMHRYIDLEMMFKYLKDDKTRFYDEFKKDGSFKIGE
ncbi:hypothetical protein C0585_05340 [Candidatus Woesearchaeota archaeon]|nr:MAG: hypothetical protein C0585_05340 [Candidatus Woesearchaeota archaeon]